MTKRFLRGRLSKKWVGWASVATQFGRARKSGSASFSHAIAFVPLLRKSVAFQSNVLAAMATCRRGQMAAAANDHAAMAAPPSTRVRLFMNHPFPKTPVSKGDRLEVPVKSRQ
ncbi:hypothetical protein J0663_00535 [Rhizobium lentis]|nr:hypothetical protein J0663_00535 [Rhizobium lentis]